MNSIRKTLFLLNATNVTALSARNFAISRPSLSASYDIVVVGGGSGGLSIASKFCPSKKVAIIEPNETHYYQPMWTLVGAGIKPLAESSRPMASLMPKSATWIKDSAQEFEPSSNSVTLKSGKKISYQYLVVAIGIELDFNRIKGLPEGFNTRGICSNYSANTVGKTWEAIQSLNGKGNAIFTFPNTPIKCAGAPQKIMYLTDSYLRQTKKRENVKIIFNSALGVIFGVPKYANILNQVAKSKNIELNFLQNLIEVKPASKEAIFENLKTKEKSTIKFEMLHITPPMRAAKILAPLADQNGFVNVDKDTLQHIQYPNIFGIGDCTNLPTSKTAAAVGGQVGILYKNMNDIMQNKKPSHKYNGYTSCPLTTSHTQCILAEFDYDLKPLETFPFDQGKERRSMYHLKKDFMPFLYWNFLLRGKWNGPGLLRKLLRFGF